MDWWNTMDPQQRRTFLIVAGIGLVALAGVAIYMAFNGSGGSTDASATDASNVGVLNGVTEIVYQNPPSPTSAPPSPRPAPVPGPMPPSPIPGPRPAPGAAPVAPGGKLPPQPIPVPGGKPKPGSKPKMPPSPAPASRPPVPGPKPAPRPGPPLPPVPTPRPAPPVAPPAPPPGSRPMLAPAIDSGVIVGAPGSPSSSLASIAQMIYGTDPTQEQLNGLEQANNLTSGDDVYPGQLIVIPGATGANYED